MLLFIILNKMIEIDDGGCGDDGFLTQSFRFSFSPFHLSLSRKAVIDKNEFSFVRQREQIE